jgi:hypothetical protein
MEEHRNRPLRNFSDIHLSDQTRIRNEVPDFDESCDYTRRELTLLAEKILIEDPRHIDEHPAILLAPHYMDRLRHEIFVSSGVPQPHVVSGLYWRTHPDGRKWWNREERADSEKKRSFYR